MRFIADKIKKIEYVFKQPVDSHPNYVNPDAYILTDRIYVGKIDDAFYAKIAENVICRNLNILPEEFKSKSRERYIVEARHLYYWLLRKKTNYSLSTLGKMLGKDHATVLHSIKTWDNMLETDVNYRTRTITIRDRINEKLLEAEKDKALVIENEDIIANWELIKDKKDDQGNYLYR